VVNRGAIGPTGREHGEMETASRKFSLFPKRRTVFHSSRETPRDPLRSIGMAIDDRDEYDRAYKVKMRNERERLVE
jgi:hypothetical protein